MRGTARPDEDYFDGTDSPDLDDSFWDDDEQPSNGDPDEETLIDSDPYADSSESNRANEDTVPQSRDSFATAGAESPTMYAVSTDEMDPLKLNGGEFSTPPLDRILEDARTVPRSPFHYSDNYLDAKASRTTHPKLARRNVMIVGVVAVLAVLLAIVLGPKLFGGSDDQPVSVSANQPTAAPTTPITGAGAGDDQSGPAIIFAYDYAYYVKRDGVAAATHFADTEVSADPVALQKSIDAVPEGTTHSLSITATTDPMVYNVILTLRTPDDGTFTYPQQYTVSQNSGKFQILKKIECQGTCPLA